VEEGRKASIEETERSKSGRGEIEEEVRPWLMPVDPWVDKEL